MQLRGQFLSRLFQARDGGVYPSMMRIRDLGAQFVGAGGEGILQADGSPAPERRGVGVMMSCPCGKCDDLHDLYVPFANPLDGGPALESNRPLWTRTGETLDDLTLAPSVFRNPEKGGCGWHGYIEHGTARSC